LLILVYKMLVCSRLRIVEVLRHSLRHAGQEGAWAVGNLGEPDGCRGQQLPSRRLVYVWWMFMNGGAGSWRHGAQCGVTLRRR
jgi:hypothetical protein